MTIEELYKAKGELITQIEVCQMKLKSINDQIISHINKPNIQEEKKK